MTGDVGGTAESAKPQAKKRSAGFPLLPLKESVEAILTIGQNGADHTQDAAAAYLGHSTTNSGAFRSKLASLRDWGLIERGNRDRVTLSALAQQLVLDGLDETSSGELLLAAFESCRIFGMLYNDSAKGTPLDVQRVRTSVVMRHGVASDQADKFVESFIESVVYAGLGQFDGSKVTLLPREAAFKARDLPEEVVERDAGDVGSAEAATYGNGPIVTPSPPGATSPAIVALRQAWPIDGGEIEFVIRTAEPLPAAIYGLVADMAEVAEKMRAKLMTATGSSAASPPPQKTGVSASESGE
ncbi:hypothetical protein [Flindersiella endophytica]